MSKVRLKPREVRYYEKLFAEDKDWYTVVDQLKQLPSFAATFADAKEQELLAFIEFLSTIFKISWRSDVYKKNHLRLMDILIGLEYAVEFKKDSEATEVISKLISRFKELYPGVTHKINRRVLEASRNTIKRFSDHIPEKGNLADQVNFFQKIDPLYGTLFREQVIAGELPDWKMIDRKGVTIDLLTNSPLHFDVEKRMNILKKNLVVNSF